MSKFQSGIFRKVKESLYQEPPDDAQLKAVCSEPSVEEEALGAGHFSTHEHFIPQQGLESQNKSFFCKHHPENAYWWSSCYPIGVDGVTEFHEGYSRVQTVGVKQQQVGVINFKYVPGPSGWELARERNNVGKSKQGWLGRMFSKKKTAQCPLCLCIDIREFKMKRGPSEDLDSVVSKRVRYSTSCALDQVGEAGTCGDILAIYLQRTLQEHTMASISSIDCVECADKQLGIVAGDSQSQFLVLLRKKVLLIELELSLQQGASQQELWAWYSHPQRPLVKAPIKSARGKSIVSAQLSWTGAEEPSTAPEHCPYSDYALFEFQFAPEEPYGERMADCLTQGLPAFENTLNLDTLVQTEQRQPLHVYCYNSPFRVQAEAGVLRSIAGQKKAWIEPVAVPIVEEDDFALQDLQTKVTLSQNTPFQHHSVFEEDCKIDRRDINNRDDDHNNYNTLSDPYETLPSLITPCSFCLTRDIHSVFLNYSRVPCCAHAATKHRLPVLSPDLPSTLIQRPQNTKIFSLFP